MEKTINQIEKNIGASFTYVKKDMLMLNDAFSDLHDKVTHLSLNHAILLGEIEKLRTEVGDRKTVSVKKVVSKTRNSVPFKKRNVVSKKKDDLTKIDGIGPAIAKLFGKYGIDSFEKMTKVSVKDLKDILDEGGSRFQMHDPSTWVGQAKVLAR